MQRRTAKIIHERIGVLVRTGQLTLIAASFSSSRSPATAVGGTHIFVLTILQLVEIKGRLTRDRIGMSHGRMPTTQAQSNRDRVFAAIRVTGVGRRGIRMVVQVGILLLLLLRAVLGQRVGGQDR